MEGCLGCGGITSTPDGLAEITLSGNLEELIVLLVLDTQNWGSGILIGHWLGTEPLEEE